MKFFSYDSEGDGFQEHETEEGARAAAQRALDYAAHDGDGYDADVISGICWGEIRERAEVTNIRDLTPEEKEEHPGWDYFGEPNLVGNEFASELAHRARLRKSVLQLLADLEFESRSWSPEASGEGAREAIRQIRNGLNILLPEKDTR